MTVFRVKTVAWNTFPTNTPLDSCPPPNNGRRIFADKNSPSDTPALPDDRRKVVIEGTVEPVPQNDSIVRVWLMKWDVDDPSADGDSDNDGDLTDEVDDQPRDLQGNVVPNSGPDNRGDQPTTPWVTPVLANGSFVTWMYVSAQPGDNYSVTATTTKDGCSNYVQQSWVDSVVRQSGGGWVQPGAATRSALASEMLTVWRRLWVEVDSMSAEPVWTNLQARYQDESATAGYYLGGSPILGFVSVVSNPPFVTVELPVALHANWNGWEGGLLVTNGFEHSYLVIRDTYQGNISVTVLEPLPANPAQYHWWLLDDDGLTWQLPDYGNYINASMKDAFAAAYIRVALAPEEWNVARTVSFSRHLAPDVRLATYMSGTGVFGAIGLESESDFWCRPIVSAYEGAISDDADGDIYENCGFSWNSDFVCPLPYPLADALGTPLPALLNTSDPGFLYGVTYRHTTLWVSQTAVSLLFKEVVRDLQPPSGAVDWQYAAHEIGHMTVWLDGHVSPEDDEHLEDGLMKDGGLTDRDTTFTNASMRRFRSCGRW